MRCRMAVKENGRLDATARRCIKRGAPFHIVYMKTVRPRPPAQEECEVQTTEHFVTANLLSSIHSRRGTRGPFQPEAFNDPASRRQAKTDSITGIEERANEDPFESALALSFRGVSCLTFTHCTLPVGVLIRCGDFLMRECATGQKTALGPAVAKLKALELSQEEARRRPLVTILSDDKAAAAAGGAPPEGVESERLLSPFNAYSLQLMGLPWARLGGPSGGTAAAGAGGGGKKK
uniref:Uncharacterized protein n=1 Tax=Chromera velia CCMP2878 TaxID=1169474 RepID=A0A0G4IFC7_9ALVE|eukprot:Cvel_13848.t1-p1 / transcript=Cvel_13848.t1 / gene=Cvel_13848 / organism=Chromera_velia_CCMP2878 / gene_product=hypothetical protein / transcript_product=hypothetical protein / location=Cvel_scaffold962:18742-29516(+) / protein_length=234 / sequence_SO=supercontig / SO=protein_coding / is_pseudo=false